MANKAQHFNYLPINVLGYTNVVGQKTADLLYDIDLLGLRVAKCLDDEEGWGAYYSYLLNTVEGEVA